MASKAKKGHTLRFDFGSNLDSEGNQTGTISELLSEINQTYNPRSGEPANFKSMKPTRDFIKKAIGINFRNTTNNISLSKLKTIKLLFMTNHEGKKLNLLSRILPPTARNRPTMESATGSTIARDKSGARLIQILSNHLATEIDPEKLKSLDDFLHSTGNYTTAQRLNAHIERTNDEIYRLLTHWLRGNNLPLANAYYRLAKEIDRAGYKKTKDHCTPLHESVFAYLQGLGFIHFALHHRSFIKEIRVKHPIHSISVETKALCQALGASSGTIVLPDRNIFSVNNFHHLVAGYPKEINFLVHAATKLDTRKKTLFENTLRAKKILAMHGLRCYDETDLDAPLLSLSDIIAALCSVRYQQKVKTKYAPYWSGQVSQGKDPQRHFDRISDPSDLYQHQGVAQIYLYRFSEYRASFTNTTESFSAWMAYQISRFDAYVRILQLNDIKGIIASSLHFDEFCLQEAMSIIKSYNGSSM